MPLEYVTNREVANKAGESKGRIKIMKMREDGFAQIDLTCPECGANEKGKRDWSEPFTSGTGSKQIFNMKCGKCGYAMKMLKLKKEAAKKK